jgi:hypothetical protein
MPGKPYESADRPISTWQARIFLLDIIAEQAPEVLNDLKKAPLVAYKIVQQTNSLGFAARPDLRDWAILESRRDHCSPPVFALRVSLLEWGKRYNLNDHWCLKVAVDTVDCWLQMPRSMERSEWAYPPASLISPISGEEGRFAFEFAVWDPTRWSRAQYQAEANRAFKGYLKDYCDGIEALASERGFVERDHKREAAHFLWLVWYQVQNRSQTWISRRANASRQTVADGIKSAAALSGLSLRSPNPPGRPKKKPHR